MAFGDRPGADRLPTRICTGTLAEFGELKQGATYFTERLSIKGIGTAKGAKCSLLWLPEWFASDFDERHLDGSAKSGPKRIYMDNLVSHDPIKRSAKLEGLCATQENLDGLADMIRSLTDVTAESVHDTLAGYFRNLGPVTFGYVLKQQTKRVEGKVNDQGRPVYELTDFYDVDEIFQLSEAKLKAVAKASQYVDRKIASGEPWLSWEWSFTPEELGFNIPINEE